MPNIVNTQWKHIWDAEDDDGTRSYELPNGLVLHPDDVFFDLNSRFSFTVTDVCTRIDDADINESRSNRDYVHFVTDWPADDPHSDRRRTVRVATFVDRLNTGQYLPHHSTTSCFQ